MRAILTYHSIDGTGSPISITPAEFQGHLAWLTSGAVRVVPLEEIHSSNAGDHQVALAFDDALATAAEWALPRLLERGLPCTVFVVSDRVGRDNQWGDRKEPGIPTLALMDWDAIRAAQAQGAEIGCHTRHHRWLPGCSDAELEDEFEGAIETLKRELGAPPRSVAYPYGATDRRVRAAAATRFQIGCTTVLRPIRPGREHPLALPRLDAWYLRNPRQLRTWGSRPQRFHLGIRRAARALRGVLQ